MLQLMPAVGVPPVRVAKARFSADHDAPVPSVVGERVDGRVEVGAVPRHAHACKRIRRVCVIKVRELLDVCGDCSRHGCLHLQSLERRNGSERWDAAIPVRDTAFS